MPTDGQDNILKIENGATIKIWLNSDAYESIYNNNSQIVIDTLSGGTMVSTSYPAYYDGDTYITDRINSDTDMEGVIDFTFRDGAWYYSGGLVSVDSLNVDDAVIQWDRETDRLILLRSGKLCTSALQVIEDYIDNYDCGEY